MSVLHQICVDPQRCVSISSGNRTVITVLDVLVRKIYALVKVNQLLSVCRVHLMMMDPVEIRLKL